MGNRQLAMTFCLGFEERFLTNFIDYSNLQKNIRQSDEDSESQSTFSGEAPTGIFSFSSPATMAIRFMVVAIAVSCCGFGVIRFMTFGMAGYATAFMFVILAGT